MLSLIEQDPIDAAIGRIDSIYCNSGQIVGYSDSRATLYDITGAGNNINLNTLIDPASEWILKGAFYIDDNGWIVGDGVNPAGNDSSYLLVPIILEHIRRLRI